MVPRGRDSHRRVMTSSRAVFGPVDKRIAAATALVPYVAFRIAVAFGAAHVSHPYGDEIGIIEPGYLVFVVVPSLLPLLAARARITLGIALVLMTWVAAGVGFAVGGSEAGDPVVALCVLVVPYVAIPLALVIWIGHTIAFVWNRCSAESRRAGTKTVLRSRFEG